MKIKPLNSLDKIEFISTNRHKLKAYLVGGCVRDWILGAKCFDIDVTFNEYPAILARKFSEKFGFRINEFKRFMTIRLLSENQRFDFATFREEKYPKPASLPEVKKTKNIELDLTRRDFSINAIAISLNKDIFEVIDPFNGVEDIKKGIIRILHKDSFKDDPTRIFRAARFSARFGWSIEKNTLKAAQKAIKYISMLSKERIRNEFIKIFQENYCYKALKILEELGVGKDIICFNYDVKIENFKTLKERLIYTAVYNKSIDFLENFNFERQIKNIARSAVIPLIEKKSPQKPLDKTVVSVIKTVYPQLPENALKPLKKTELKRLLLSKKNPVDAISAGRKKRFSGKN
ncbi:MAG: hypothetical protein K6357_00400 [Elusimicrobiota bacterium]